MLLSVFSVLVAVIGLNLISTKEFNLQLLIHLEEQFPQVDGWEVVEMTMFINMIVFLLLGLKNIIVSSLLIHGASVSKPSLLTPWLVLCILASAHCFKDHK